MSILKAFVCTCTLGVPHGLAATGPVFYLRTPSFRGNVIFLQLTDDQAGLKARAYDFAAGVFPQCPGVLLLWLMSPCHLELILTSCESRG